MSGEDEAATHLDGLGDPQGEDQVDKVQGSEEEEDPTLVEGDDEQGGGSGDGKVVQPLRGVGKGDTCGATTNIELHQSTDTLKETWGRLTISSRPRVEQFRDVNPDQPSPRETIRNNKEVDQDGHPDRRPASLGSVLIRRMSVEDGSDHHQESPHAQSSVDKVLFPARSLDTEGHEEGGGDDLDESVDTGSEERGLGTGDSDRVEDLGGVVVDRVLSGPFCEETTDEVRY